MRKHLKMLAVLMMALLLFAGCGSDDNNQSTDAAEQENNGQTEETNTNETEEEAEADEEEEDYRIVATTVARVEIMDASDLDLVSIPISYKKLPDRYDDAVDVGMGAEQDMEIIKSLIPTAV